MSNPIEFPPPLPSRIARPNAQEHIFRAAIYVLCGKVMIRSYRSVARLCCLAIIISSCHTFEPSPKPITCPAQNARKMPLVGIDKCGCLYGVPACNAGDCMYTTDRKPCL